MLYMWNISSSTHHCAACMRNIIKLATLVSITLWKDEGLFEWYLIKNQLDIWQHSVYLAMKSILTCNQDIYDRLSYIKLMSSMQFIYIRSPLTYKALSRFINCVALKSIHHNIIKLGEVVHIIMGQVVEEPSTQLVN